MNKIYPFILIFLLIGIVSCNKVLYPRFEGDFQSSGKDYRYTLIIKNDNTFIFNKQDLDVKKNCRGSWKYTTKDTILLKCGDEPITNTFSTGYMYEREIKIIVINPQKIKIDKLILKKTKK